MQKLVETGRRKLSERVRGAAVSLFLSTAAPGNADLAQNPVRKGRSVPGARNNEILHATITGT